MHPALLAGQAMTPHSAPATKRKNIYVRIPLGDSYYGEWRDKLDLQTTEDQDRACCYLEGKGQVFLVDYGYENAIEKAKALRKAYRKQEGITVR